MEKQFKEALRQWIQAMLDDSRLTTSLPPLSVAISDRLRDEQIAQIVRRPDQTVFIEVAYRFVGELQTLIAKNREALTNACFDGVEFDPADPVATQAVAEAAKSLTISFDVLHEVFHLLSGHLSVGVSDDVSAASSQTIGESSLDFTMHDGLDATVEIVPLRRRYYRELEADNCALQCLSQLPLPAPVMNLLDSIQFDDSEAPVPNRILELDSIHRAMGFRLLAATSWLIVQLIELKRSIFLKRKLREYPLSSARLLAGLTTLLEESAGLSGARVDSTGRRSHTLTEEDVENIRWFLSYVLKPVTLFLPSAVATTEQTTSMIELMQDLGALLIGGETKTAAGIEVLELQTLRKDMDERYGPHRYYNP